MKRLHFLLIAVVGLFLTTTMSSCSKVPAGYAGVKVYLIGGNKGVDNEVLGVGRYYIGFNEELFLYPTYQVNYTFTQDSTEGSEDNEEFSFQTKEGMECEMDLGVAMHFEPSKISKMFQTYRKGEEEIRGIVVRNTIRDALNKVGGTMPVEYAYGEGKAKLVDTVKTIVKTQLFESGIVIDNVYLIGSIRIPDAVKTALNAKITATQKALEAENKVKQAEAEAKIKIAQAEGEAKAMDVKGDAIRRNPSILQQAAIEKWNGILPVYMGGNAPMPFLNVK